MWEENGRIGHWDFAERRNWRTEEEEEENPNPNIKKNRVLKGWGMNLDAGDALLYKFGVFCFFSRI